MSPILASTTIRYCFNVWEDGNSVHANYARNTLTPQTSTNDCNTGFNCSTNIPQTRRESKQEVKEFDMIVTDIQGDTGNVSYLIRPFEIVKKREKSRWQIIDHLENVSYSTN
jgi:hypothetical protein